MKYTKKQLVKAQRAWNKDVVNNPDNYKDPEPTETLSKDYAKVQINALLSFLKD